MLYRIENESCPICDEEVNESMEVVYVEQQVAPYASILMTAHKACAMSDPAIEPCPECVIAAREGRTHEH